MKNFKNLTFTGTVGVTPFDFISEGSFDYDDFVTQNPNLSEEQAKITYGQLSSRYFLPFNAKTKKGFKVVSKMEFIK
jgi:hypothetical protein